MTPEEKELLLKDLCARAPYGIKCSCYDGRLTATLTGVKSDTELYFHEFDWKEDNGIIEVEFCKPYLLPLSSMTDEQLKLFDGVFLPNGHVVASDLGLDYLNSIYVDYRGLIPRGLAKDATGLNIY